MSAAEASSKTYRKVNNQLAGVLGKEAAHSRSPSIDFERLLGELQNAADLTAKQREDIAVQFYKLGVKRGMITATDLMASGHFTCPKEGTVEVNGDTRFSRQLLLKGGKKRRINMTLKPKDLGFID